VSSWIVSAQVLWLIPFVYTGAHSIFADYYTYLPNNLSLFGFQSIVSWCLIPIITMRSTVLWTIRYEFSLFTSPWLVCFYKKVKIGVRTLLRFAHVYCFIFFIDKVAGAKY
jgi:hypothetical protein